MQSQMLWAAVGALSQSYDYLVLDGGAMTDIDLPSAAAIAPYAVLVGGDTPAATLEAAATEVQSAGFADLSVLTGPPPALEEAAAQSAA